MAFYVVQTSADDNTSFNLTDCAYVNHKRISAYEFMTGSNNN